MTFALESSLTRLGRSSANEIQILDEEASRFHAEIRKNNNHIVLVDCNSANGTYLNGSRVKLADLTNGDQIQFGKTVLLLMNSPSQMESTNDPLLLISQDSNPVDSNHVRSDAQRRSPHRRQLVSDSPVHVSSASHSSSIFRSAPIVVAESQSNLHTLFATIDVIRKTSDENELLQKILGHLFTLTAADRGAVLLYSPISKELRPAVSMDKVPHSNSKNRITISESIINYVVEKRQGVLTHSAVDDVRWSSSDSLNSANVNEAMCVPLLGKHDLLGLIYVDTRSNVDELSPESPTTRFQQQQLETAIAVGQQAALALEYSRYYSALLENERLAAIGQLAANLSHHIKNMMQGIESGAYLLNNGLAQKSWELAQRGWNIVKTNQEEVSLTFMNILSYSREREPRLSPTNVNQLMSKVIRFAESIGVANNIKIDFESSLKPEWENIQLDSQGIYHAMLNLVSNAIDACKGRENGLISIAIGISDDLVDLLINISDNGCGISPENQVLIFNEYFSSKGQTGTGIGLKTTKKIIDEHRGRIEFQSTKKGTTFTIAIPVEVAFRPDPKMNDLSSESKTLMPPHE